MVLFDLVQNFVSKYGIYELFDVGIGMMMFRYYGELICVLYMIGDICFFDWWCYYVNYIDVLLCDGQLFVLLDGMLVLFDVVVVCIVVVDYVCLVGLIVVFVVIEISVGVYLQVIDELGGMMFVGSGNYEVVFIVICDIVWLNVYVMYLFGLLLLLLCEVWVDGYVQCKGIELMVYFWYQVVVGVVIMLCVMSFGGQQCNVIWWLCEVLDMQQ